MHAAWEAVKGPLCLSTWPFGRTANNAAFLALERGASPLAAAIAGVTAVENDPSVHSVGLGGLPDRAGAVTLDAAVMESPRHCAGVGFFSWCANPARVAERVMRETRHTLVVGEGAHQIARELRLPAQELLTDDSRREWTRKFGCEPAADDTHDTIATIARDAEGRFSAATSTSGLANKEHGRIGDSPVIGHGLYVHPRYGAAVCTGTGELASKTCAAFLLVELLRAGKTPRAAVESYFLRLQEDLELEEQHQLGVIVLSFGGTWSAGAIRKGFVTAVRTAAGESLVEPEFLLHASA